MKANKKNCFYHDNDFPHTWSKMKKSTFYLLYSFLVVILDVHFSILYLLKTFSSRKMYSRNGFACCLVWFIWLQPEKQRVIWFSSIPGEVGVDFKSLCYFRSAWHAMEYCFSKLSEFLHSLHILTVILVIRSRKSAPFPSGFAQVHLIYCWSNDGVLQTRISFLHWNASVMW